MKTVSLFAIEPYSHNESAVAVARDTGQLVCFVYQSRIKKINRPNEDDSDEKNEIGKCRERRHRVKAKKIYSLTGQVDIVR